MGQRLEASQVRVAYTDGSEVVASIRPVHLVRAERQYGEKMRGHLAEATLYASWLALGSPGAPAVTFDSWLDTLDSFDEGGLPESDPTPAAVSIDAQQS